MLRLAPGVELPESAVAFTRIAGGGPGGQHANKTASRVELRVRLADIPLPPDALDRLAMLAGERLTEAGELVLTCDDTRSARQNQAQVVERLGQLVLAAQVRPKVRRRTRRTRGSVERRLAAKRSRSETLRERRQD